jgi:nickel/cobalt transporter (NicO) family protein
MKNPCIVINNIVILVVIFSTNAFCHINDELAIRSIIDLDDEGINLTLRLEAGMMFGQFFLETLDPDKNQIFEHQDIDNFSAYLLSNIKIKLDSIDIAPVSYTVNFSSFQEFIAGLSEIEYHYSIDYPEDLNSDHAFFYENSILPEVALYVMDVKADNEMNIGIINEERNEMLQDLVTITFGEVSDIPIAAMKQESSAAFKISTPELNFKTSANLVDRIRDGNFNTALMSLLSIVIGFLHAFTPGHGKSLVGAYLVANQGTIFQALGLGIIVTLTHTLSIYVFGGLASVAAYLFIPSRIIPLMTICTGGLVLGIGLWSVLRRFLGMEVDHAHILPNLRILQKNSINILVDGSAVDSSEFLAIESEEDYIQERLKAAGAEGINICSPGCETHRTTPIKLAERQNIQLMKMAVKTGAVGAVISGRKNILKQVSKIETSLSVGFYSSVENAKDAESLIENAITNFQNRDEISIPEDRLPWKRLIPLGIAGGAVPCADAMAILLISFSIGQLALGFFIVFAFSTGLAAALVLVGTMIVMSNRVMEKSRYYQKISGLIPYLSALFLVGIGSYMIIRSI